LARILLIDDDEAVRRAMRMVLERAGHEVTVAANGVDGMRLYHAAAFDLVITDLYMPEKEGIETIQELRAERPDVLILAVSGGLLGDKEGPLTDAELLGATATLAKPFSNEELQTTVARLLDTDRSA
jgi:CheY-like chemotaxis protein